MRLRQFSAQESRKKKKQENTSENNNGSRILKKNFHVIFSLCNLDGSGKVLKLLCGVWKEVIFKRQKIVQTTWSLVL